MITQKTSVDMPDHGISYDVKIISIETSEDPHIVLFKDVGARVTACKPVLRAAASENDHFSTHMVTIPVERERSALEKVVMKVPLDVNYTIVSTFEIDPSKIDLKYNHDQSGLGDRNFGCHLCTAARADWFVKEKILAGFPMNRSLKTTLVEAERRRINPDCETQASLKLKSKGVTHTPIYQAEHVRHLVDPLHNGLSFGRALVDLLVRFNADIFSPTIEASVKPTYDASKADMKNLILQKFGFNPFVSMTGVQVAAVYKIDNHEKLMSLVPDVHKEVMDHYVKETRFYLGFIFHMDPHSTFVLEEVESRFESMLIFIAEEMSWWNPADYFHVGPAHVVQILSMKNSQGKFKYQNLTSTGTQDKENKNQKQRLFFRSLARKDSNQNAISDVLIRDYEESSLTMREHGQTHPVHKCGVCGGLGHHRNSKKCPQASSRGKFIDISQTHPKYLLSDSDTDSSIDSDMSEVSCENSVEDVEVTIDETVDDMELEEALSASPVAAEEVDQIVYERNAKRKLSLDLSD